MIPDTRLTYKLMILFMLSKVNFPLTKAQVGDFVLKKEYMNFMTLQQIFAELLDAEMITAQTIRNRTHLSLTESGRQTIAYFSSRISPHIREDIINFLQENEMELRNEVSITADYHKLPNGEYATHLVAKENGTSLLEIQLTVPFEGAAASICDKWQQTNQEIYQYLVKKLF